MMGAHIKYSPSPIRCEPCTRLPYPSISSKSALGSRMQPIIKRRDQPAIVMLRIRPTARDLRGQSSRTVAPSLTTSNGITHLLFHATSKLLGDRALMIHNRPTRVVH